MHRLPLDRLRFATRGLHMGSTQRLLSTLWQLLRGTAVEMHDTVTKPRGRTDGGVGIALDGGEMRKAALCRVQLHSQDCYQDEEAGSGSAQAGPERAT